MTLPSFTGSLTNFENYDATRHIGTIFPNKDVQISELLSAKNSDELIKDLATLVSHRGVVFFKDQDLNITQQKELAQRMGQLSGKPDTSKLHKHPLTPDEAELGKEVTVISSKMYVQFFFFENILNMLIWLFSHLRKLEYTEERGRLASRGWHSDITFEPVPSDYAVGYAF